MVSEQIDKDIVFMFDVIALWMQTLRQFALTDPHNMRPKVKKLYDTCMQQQSDNSATLRSSSRSFRQVPSNTSDSQAISLVNKGSSSPSSDAISSHSDRMNHLSGGISNADPFHLELHPNPAPPQPSHSFPLDKDLSQDSHQSEERLLSGKGEDSQRKSSKATEHSTMDVRMTTAPDLCDQMKNVTPAVQNTISARRVKKHMPQSPVSSLKMKRRVTPRRVDPQEDPKAVIDRRLSLVGPRYGPDGSMKNPRFINPPYVRKTPRKASPPWIKPADLSQTKHSGLTLVTMNEEVTALLEADWEARNDRNRGKETVIQKKSDTNCDGKSTATAPSYTVHNKNHETNVNTNDAINEQKGINNNTTSIVTTLIGTTDTGSKVANDGLNNADGNNTESTIGTPSNKTKRHRRPRD